jgi:predicted Fe-Mo cluster-binding NifX family protein
MRLAIPVHDDRVSPLLDVAERFLIVDVTGRGERRREVAVHETSIGARARRIVELGTGVLICGAVTRPLESMLVAMGLRVIPNTCGPVEEVIAAFASGRLTDRAFLMPGCRGRRRRHRGGGRGRGRRGRR